MKAIKSITQFFCLSLGLVFYVPAISVSAATATVLVGSGGLVFVPATTNIMVNDRVIWSWSGNNHSTTSGTTSGTTKSPDGLWDSGVANSPHSFTNIFSTAGTFPYYCSIHFASGMKGTINVVAANMPPTITITNPASGTTLSAPAGLTLAASAADSDGTITNVQFLQGANVLGNVTSSPFSIRVNNLAASSYTFSAIASDNNGATATNTILVNVINANSVMLSTPAAAVARNFQFQYSADVGLKYVVFVSTNLSTGWSALQTNMATTNPMTFTNSAVNGSAAFYRVERLPNP